MRPSIRIWLNSKIYEYIVDGLSLSSSPLSSALMCLRMRSITPAHTSNVPQLESGISHEATISSVHWQCRLDIFEIVMEIYYLRASEHSHDTLRLLVRYQIALSIFISLPSLWWLLLHKYFMAFITQNCEKSSGPKAESIASQHSICPWL